MKKMKLAVVFAASTALAGPALAGTIIEPIVETPPTPIAAPAFSWTGGYVGLGLGWAETTEETDFRPMPRELDLMASTFTESGLAYGAFVGYNQQLNDFVIGGEFEIGSIRFQDDLELDYVMRLKGRVGFAMDNVLIYGTGGAAYASAYGSSDWGYFGGVGIEVAMAGNWFAGLEATQTRFDDFDDSGWSVTTNTVNARLGFRF